MDKKIKVSNLKVSWPEIDHHSESDSQVKIKSEIYFEKADITTAFEKSGIIEETAKFNERYKAEDEPAADEAGNREEALIDFLSDFEKELKDDLEKELDDKLKAIPGYVATTVTVNLYGKDSKDMHGSFEVVISVDIEMSDINRALESVFESMR